MAISWVSFVLLISQSDGRFNALTEFLLWFSVIRDMVRLERALDDSLEHLKIRCQTLRPDTDMSDTDDLDSITSSRLGLHGSISRKPVVRFAGQEREVEQLKAKLANVEKENISLRQEVSELKDIVGHDDTQQNSEEKKADHGVTDLVELSEGGIWHLVRKMNFKDKKRSGHH
jgi:regulator of replication initiation timing